VAKVVAVKVSGWGSWVRNLDPISNPRDFKEQIPIISFFPLSNAYGLGRMTLFFPDIEKLETSTLFLLRSNLEKLILFKIPILSCGRNL
jgi:hypothetical protein